MKLVLGRKDYIRCQILSRKISKRHISVKDLESQKIQYFTYMIELYIHDKKHFETA